MLRYLLAEARAAYPRLSSTIFRDRARHSSGVSARTSSSRRMGKSAIPAIAAIRFMSSGRTAGGTHGGSMRFLPTTGLTMVGDHFSDRTRGVRIRSPDIWECTRFCLSSDAGRYVAAALMLGGLEVGLARGLSHAINVFDAPMIRVYRRLG